MPVDYILERSDTWKAEKLKNLIEEEIAEKRWQIRTSLLSHTPMTDDSAKAMEREIKDIEREFGALLRSFSKRPEKDEPIVSSCRIQLGPGESLGYSLS